MRYLRSTKVDYINRLRKTSFLRGRRGLSVVYEVIRVRKDVKKSVVLCYEHEGVKEKTFKVISSNEKLFRNTA